MHDDGVDTTHQPKPKLPSFGRLLSLAKPDANFLFAGLFSLFLRLPFSLAAPHFTSRAIGGTIDGDTEKAKVNIKAFVIAGAVNSFVDFFNVFLFSLVQAKIVRRLRSTLFQKIMSQEMGFFDATTSGSLSSRLTSDCVTIGSDLSWVLRNVAEAIVRVCGISIYLLVQNVKLGSVACCAAPLVAVFARVYGEWMARNAKASADALADASAVALEAIANKKTVASFANEKYEESKYNKKLKTWFHLNTSQAAVTGIYYSLVYSFCAQMAIPAVLLLYGTHLVLRDEMHAEKLIAVMLYQSQLQEYVGNLLDSVTSMYKSSGSATAAFQLIDRTPMGNQSGNESIDPEVLQGAIEFKDVHFRYPSRVDTPVLRGLSLICEPNAMTALVGQSGSGKSTVFSLLLRFYQPQVGQITLDGIDIYALDKAWLHGVIGVVSQEPVLFSGTVEENITYSLGKGKTETEIENGEREKRNDETSDEEFGTGDTNGQKHTTSPPSRATMQASTAANAHGFITKMPLGYRTTVGEGGGNLSGGQKQRVAIARAILKNPKVLLLDEATSSLDCKSEEDVQRALDLVSAGRTTLTIAHRFCAIKNARFIYNLKDGTVKEKGTREQLVNLYPNNEKAPAGSYKAMYSMYEGEQYDF